MRHANAAVFGRDPHFTRSAGNVAEQGHERGDGCNGAGGEVATYVFTVVRLNSFHCREKTFTFASLCCDLCGTCFMVPISTLCAKSRTWKSRAWIRNISNFKFIQTLNSSSSFCHNARLVYRFQ